MNFADSKQNNLTKKCVVRVFTANHSSSKKLSDQVFENKKFAKNKIIKVNTTKSIKIRDIKKEANSSYVYFSIFNPKESVSISPKVTGDKDLIDIENYDTCHVFANITKNTIVAIFQISTNWPENKLMLIFENFGINIKPASVIDQRVTDALKKEGFKSLHANINVHASDFKKQPSFLESLIKNEPKVGNQVISGHLEISGSGNSSIAQSIEKNPQGWIDDLDSDFYIETKKGRKIQGDDIKLNRTYYTLPYGSKTINSKYAKEIIEHFIQNEL